MGFSCRLRHHIIASGPLPLGSGGLGHNAAGRRMRPPHLEEERRRQLIARPREGRFVVLDVACGPDAHLLRAKGEHPPVLRPDCAGARESGEGAVSLPLGDGARGVNIAAGEGSDLAGRRGLPLGTRVHGTYPACANRIRSRLSAVPISLASKGRSSSLSHRLFPRTRSSTRKRTRYIRMNLSLRRSSALSVAGRFLRNRSFPMISAATWDTAFWKAFRTACFAAAAAVERKKKKTYPPMAEEWIALSDRRRSGVFMSFFASLPRPFSSTFPGNASRAACCGSRPAGSEVRASPPGSRSPRPEPPQAI